MNHNHLSDEDEKLIRGCLENNRAAQESLYRKYSKTMYHICLSFTGNRDEAKDILQESFIKVFRKLKDYNGQGSLEGWIRRVVNRTAIDHYRKYNKLSYFKDIAEVKEMEAQLPEEQISQVNTNSILKYIQMLPNGARTIFNLFAVEGYSHKEIAVKLNISEGTSKSQYNRARSLLQEKIQNGF